jgi:hypothetical protein
LINERSHEIKKAKPAIRYGIENKEAAQKSVAKMSHPINNATAINISPAMSGHL